MQCSEVGGRVVHGANGLGRGGSEVLEATGAAGMGDDLGLWEELVPPAVVTVVMGVEQSRWCGWMHLGVQAPEPPRQCQVVERVDNETTAGGDQPRVREAETLAALHACEGV